MPTSAPDKQKKVRRKINPATCTQEELLSHLATDATAGLSPKEAERRRSLNRTQPLYRTTIRRVRDYIKRVAREPAMWLMLCLSIVSLFFDRIALGIVCLLLSGGHAAVCVLIARRADRIDAAMQAYDAPLSRVLRGGRIYRIAANELVRGDILLFRPGDMIPADCRLLTTDGFVVSEREIDAAATDRPAVRLDKDANANAETSGHFRTSPVNMVFAGGLVEAGSATAVVIAVGRDTHIGGLLGDLASRRAGRTPDLFRRSGRFLSIYNVCTLCLILPIVAIGIFTVGKSYEFLDIFLSALALVTLTLTEHILMKGLFVFSSIRRDAAMGRDTVNTADIKTSADLETLATVTDVLLVGTAALHDGACHPETLYTGGMTYHCDHPQADDAARTIAELVYLYQYAITEMGLSVKGCILSQTTIRDLACLVPALSAWTDMDVEALHVKMRDIRLEDIGVSAVFPTAEGNARIAVRLTDDIDTLRACDEIFTAGALRAIRPMATEADRAHPGRGDERFEELQRTHRAAERAGLRSVFLVTYASGKSTIRAMITYAPHTSPKTLGVIKSMENAGIRVAACLYDISPANTRVLSACGLEETKPAYRPTAGDGHPAISTLLSEGYRAFEGCTESAILTAIRDLQDAGRTVAVLSVERADIALLNAADVAITCAPSLYAMAEAGAVRVPAAEFAPLSDTRTPDGGSDGEPESTVASDLSRRRADVIVRRATVTGGGIAGVRRAILTADHAKTTLDRIFVFLLLSQTLRIVSVLLPLCMGLTLAAAPVLLLSGHLADMIVLFAAASFPVGDTPAPRHSMDHGLDRPWLTYRGRLIAVALSAVLPWIAAGIAKLLDADFGADLVYFGALCTFGLQVALFRAERLPRRNSTVFFTTLALVLLYIATVAASIGSGLSLLWALLIPPVISALGFAFVRILSHFDLRD